MKHYKLSGACAIVALIALALAGSAQASAQSSAAPTAPMIVAPPSLDPLTNAEVAATVRMGIPLPRAREAVEVQSAVERNNLINKLKAALGDAYGGVWYVPAAAQLDVGVTSVAAARIAEAVAVRAGLGLYVTEIPVDSSNAEIAETQKRLNRRLADLFARNEVTTWGSVEDNSVHVELGSEVPADERASLEAEASKSAVEVVVTHAPRPKLRVVLEARCREFEKNKANCDPTIVAGTRLEDSGKVPCTTGPAVAQPKGSTEIYVLTAGHCVKKVGDSFFATNKAGTKTVEVGKAVAFLSPEAKNNADVAAIKVENAFWKQAGVIPVIPAIAEWKAKMETEPFKVKGQTPPALKAKTCISGQSTGFSCGTILKKELTSEAGIEELVEVGTAKSEGGDSGGPWFSEAGEKKVEGIHHGRNEANNNPLFEPLEFVLQRLKEVSKLELELLTEANETRM